MLAEPSTSMTVAGLSGAANGGGCRYEFSDAADEALKDDGQWFGCSGGGGLWRCWCWCWCWGWRCGSKSLVMLLNDGKMRLSPSWRTSGGSLSDSGGLANWRWLCMDDGDDDGSDSGARGGWWW